MVVREAVVGASRDTGLRELPPVAGSFVRERGRVVNADLRGRSRREQAGEGREIDARAFPVRDAVDERADEEVAVDVLEEVNAARADVADFGHVVAAELVLDAERPIPPEG